MFFTHTFFPQVAHRGSVFRRQEHGLLYPGFRDKYRIPTLIHWRLVKQTFYGLSHLSFLPVSLIAHPRVDLALCGHFPQDLSHSHVFKQQHTHRHSPRHSLGRLKSMALQWHCDICLNSLLHTDVVLLLEGKGRYLKHLLKSIPSLLQTLRLFLNSNMPRAEYGDLPGTSSQGLTLCLDLVGVLCTFSTGG